MNFKSTRGGGASSFIEAFTQGLAQDGGLFVPEYFPDITNKLEEYSHLSYSELAAEFLSLFAPEISKTEWSEITQKSYEHFSSPDVVAIKNISKDNSLYMLELFHGPTLAFKDFALQVVGSLYEREAKRTGNTFTIVGATSGDTGSAAIYGVINNPSVNIFIMYPKGKIAHEQELQITTTGSSRVFPIAIEGTFDDAQGIVKKLFSDVNFAKDIHIAAVNSINIARILAQSVYYLYTYLQIKKNHGDTRITFVVPTGNFGNVLSGWILSKMGVSGDFVLATNENDVLHTLWTTGEYGKKKAVATHAPSMDIQQASNFERLLYYMYDENVEKVKKTLDDFQQGIPVTLDKNLIPKEITSISVTDSEIENAIADCYKTYNYILDPHTACAYVYTQKVDVRESEKIHVLLATASPAKFPDVIHKTIGVTPTDKILESLRDKEMKFVTKSAEVGEIKGYIQECLFKVKE